MPIKFRIIIIGILGLFLLSTFFVYADEDRNPLTSSYLFFLYYDNGQLFANRDYEFAYDVVPEEFISETPNTQFPFKGEVINLKGEIAVTFQFDPRRGDPQFLKGTINVKAPYVPDGQKVNFYNAQGNSLLSIFVSDSSFCNDDGVCNADVGEDNSTCPSDCKTATPVSTTITTGASAGNGMLKIIIYLIIGLGLVVGGWFGWKWWQKRKQSLVTEMPENFPPTMPNNQNPTE